MPNPIATYSTLKFLWNESKPVRDWLWTKLPSAKDAKKREAAETHLAKLMDDANDLTRNVAPDSVDALLDQRVEQFRQALLREKIPPQEVDVLTERGSLFVRMLVTGPMGEIGGLRQRVALLEQEVAALQAQQQAMENRSVEQSSALSRLTDTERQLATFRQTQTWTMVVVAVGILIAIALAFLRN
jgi:hypothetical protein